MKGRCHKLHLSDWDTKVASDAVGWLTLNRDNALHQSYVVDADRFGDLPGDDQANITASLRATALSYVERKVDFLSEMMQVGTYVLGHDEPKAKDIRARQLYEIAVLCATTMADHDEITPLAERTKNSARDAVEVGRNVAAIT